MLPLSYLMMFNSMCKVLCQLDAKKLLKSHDVVFNIILV